MRQIYKAALLIAATMGIFSCSKKDNGNSNNQNPINPINPTSSLNTLEKQVIGDWLLDKYIDSNYSYTTLQYVSTTILSCKKDDVYTFRTDKKYTLNRGTDTCLNSTSQGELSWSIDTQTTNFHYYDGPSIYGDGGYYQKIDDTHFVVHSSYYLSATNQGTRYIFYKKK